MGSGTWAFQRTHYWTLKSKMAENSHHQNRNDVIFCRWKKFGRVGQNDMPTAIIWSKSKPEVEFQYGGRLFFEPEIVISQLWSEL